MIEYRNECVGCDVCYNCGKKCVETLICDKCKQDIYGDYYHTADGDICEDCMAESEEVEKLMTLQNVLTLGEEETVTVELNGFWAYCLAQDEMERMFEKWLNSLPEWERFSSYIKPYVMDNYGALEFVKELADKHDPDAEEIMNERAEQ